MADATFIAAIILCGVFIILIVAILKSGIEGAIKMWNVMGALTGVAFGAITSFYFTNQINQSEISSLKSTTLEVVSAFNAVSKKAEDANRKILSFEPIVRNNDNPFISIPKDKAERFVKELESTSNDLKEIEFYKTKVNNLTPSNINLEEFKLDLINDHQDKK